MSKSVHRTLARCTAAVLALAAATAAMPAHATDLGARQSFAKTDAILGGSSALSAILSQQDGASAPAALVPASRGSWKPSQSRFYASPAVARSDMPDVFGSVALRVQRTSLDKRWHAVAKNDLGGPSADFARSLSRLNEAERLEQVNRYVNRRVAFVDDKRQFGRSDVWLSAAATLKRGKGDCEDYAIAKMQMLRKAGIADKDLYLVILKDLVRRADHAVLVVRSEGRLRLLDNGTDTVEDAELRSDYRPVLTFAESGTWIHGYRKPADTFQMASADIRPVMPAAGAAN
ncbi:MAG: transglutaminase-like cysteine peptidase [Sphingomicrobium sp.]